MRTDKLSRRAMLAGAAAALPATAVAMPPGLTYFRDDDDPAIKGHDRLWSYFLHRDLAAAIERLVA